jgi:hypothetical protein
MNTSEKTHFSAPLSYHGKINGSSSSNDLVPLLVAELDTLSSGSFLGTNETGMDVF